MIVFGYKFITKVVGNYYEVKIAKTIRALTINLLVILQPLADAVKLGYYLGKFLGEIWQLFSLISGHTGGATILVVPT